MDRWIDIETAKKLLKNVCEFLEVDKEGVSDFKIKNGKEAVLLSLYTGAFFILNEKYKFKFRPIADAFHAREPLTLIPSQEEVWPSSEIVPIFAKPFSYYFKFFPNLNSPKYLFMVDGSKYRSASGYFHPERIIEDMNSKIKESGLNPTDCLIWCSDGDGKYGEEFWEYIAGIVLRDRGYFVTCYSLGGGDLYAYYVPEYLEKLIKRKFIDKGCFIEELEMFSIKNAAKTFSNLMTIKNKFECVVIEAESSEMRTRSTAENAGVGQVIKYLLDYEAGYTHGFVAGPFTKVDDIGGEYRNIVGLISCNENGELIFNEPGPYREPSEKIVEIIKNVIKCSLLRNLSFKERCDIIGVEYRNIKDYFEKILSLDIDTILDKIEEKQPK